MSVFIDPLGAYTLHPGDHIVAQVQSLNAIGWSTMSSDNTVNYAIAMVVPQTPPTLANGAHTNNT